MMNLNPLNVNFIGPFAVNATSLLSNRFELFTSTFNGDKYDLCHIKNTGSYPHAESIRLFELDDLPRSLAYYPHDGRSYSSAPMNALFIGRNNGLFYIDLSGDLPYTLDVIDGTEFHVIKKVQAYKNSILFTAEGLYGILEIDRNDIINKAYTERVFYKRDSIIDDFYFNGEDNLLLISNVSGLYAVNMTTNVEVVVSSNNISYKGLYLYYEPASNLQTYIIALVIVISVLFIVSITFTVLKRAKGCRGCSCSCCVRRPTSRNPLYISSTSQVDYPVTVEAQNNAVEEEMIREEETKQKATCSECQQQNALAVITPCGHEVVCLPCGTVMREEGMKCPKCGGEIEAVWPR